MADKYFSKNDHRVELKNTTANDVEIGSGVFLEGDIVDLYEQADVFMSNYGMGGCKTIEEYV